MKLVEQSHEITQITPDPLRLIEAAGRTCYKSEDKITVDSAENFVRRLKKIGHHSVIEHAYATVRFVTNRGVTHELVRHRLASYCLSGDTKVRRYCNTKPAMSIKELYNRQQIGQLRGRNKLMELRSMNENGVIIPNKFLKVVFSGKKIVFEVTTNMGYKIKTSLNHLFFTPNGQKPLKKLVVGNTVLINGLELVKTPEWLRQKYHKECLSLAHIATSAGCGYSTVRKYLKEFGLTKPLGAKPKNFIPWNKGLTEENDARVKKQANALRMNHHNNGKGEKSSSWKGDKIETLSGKRLRFSKYKKTECEICGSTINLENHHRDHNPENWHESNKITLCMKCHKLHHLGDVVKHVIPDTIVSIKKIGYEDTYDIEMKPPYHNFVANGFIVHNSQESTRYVNYGGRDIEFIKPVWWNDEALPIDLNQPLNDREFDENEIKTPEFSFLFSLSAAEMSYGLLLIRGWRPEQAREVLPDTLKTEIVMTANLREWMHVFNLRCSSAAHPQMRALMKACRNDFRERIPVLFD